MTRTHLKIAVVVLLAVALLSAVRATMAVMSARALAENGLRVTGTLHESDAPRRSSPWVTIDYTVTDTRGTAVPFRQQYSVSPALFDTIVTDQTATILYDPTNPMISTIDGQDGFPLLKLIGVGLPLVMVLFIIVRWKFLVGLIEKQQANDAAENADAAP